MLLTDTSFKKAAKIDTLATQNIDKSILNL